MSSYKVSRETISLVVDVIKNDEYSDDFSNKFKNMSNDELFDYLEELNQHNLNTMYGEDDWGEFPNHHYIKLDEDSMQHHKSVENYLYQTCDTDDCVNDDLFYELQNWATKYYDQLNVDDTLWDIGDKLNDQIIEDITQKYLDVQKYEVLYGRGGLWIITLRDIFDKGANFCSDVKSIMNELERYDRYFNTENENKMKMYPLEDDGDKVVIEIYEKQ